MRPFSTGAVLALTAFLAGCEHDCFLIEITPEGEGFQRRLTCWHAMDDKEGTIKPLAEKELARLAKLYQKRETPADAQKQTFWGRFTGNTPADVGGAGSYTHWSTPLGSTSAYVERFRGHDDLEAQLAQRRAAADQLTDLLVGWFQAELGPGPDFDRLRKFLDEDLRRDLKNLGLYLWTGSAAARPGCDPGAEFRVRMGQYLVERGYAAPQDAPAIGRAVSSPDMPEGFLSMVQRFVARKMGVPDDRPIPASLAFLADSGRLRASWDKYVRTTELFKRRVQQWDEEKKTNPKAEEPTPDGLANELLLKGVLRFEMAPTPDKLELRLACEEKPFQTSGTWDQQAGSVNWSSPLDEHASLPVVCFAFWSRADRAAQEKHFGRVVLAGGGLAEYVLWYRGLTSEEARQWDEFIAGLKPVGELKAAVEAFRFPSDPKPDPNKPDEKPASLADTPRRLILAGLKEK